jgi:hypothetical protein
MKKKQFVERCGVALDELRHTRGKKQPFNQAAAAKGQSSM